MVDYKHKHHFKKATILAIFAIVGTVINASVIFVLTQVLGIEAIFAGYASSGTTGFLIYLMSAYLGHEKPPSI
jgi:hypothetical protein